MKIKCPTGVHHSVEETRTCPNCIEFMTKPVLHSLLNRNSKEKKEHDRPRFGVGTLTSNCLRQSYYKLTEEEILDLEKLWIFSRGHALHEFVTQTLAPKTEKEIFVTKKFNNFDIIFFREIRNWGHISRMSKKVNGDNGGDAPASYARQKATS